jgi:pimeloyl-ACP methyl ester carboxylesterase
MPGLDLEQPDTRAAQFYADMLSKLTAPDHEEFFRRMYASYFGAQAAPELVHAIVADACRTPPAVRVAEMKLMAVDTATPAASLQQPTLVIVGQWLADNSRPAADPTRLKTYFQHLEFARAIGTGHFVQLEAPEQTNAFLTSFVSRLP